MQPRLTRSGMKTQAMSAPKADTDVAMCRKPLHNREVEQELNGKSCTHSKLCMPPRKCQELYGPIALAQNQLELVGQDATAMVAPETIESS